MIRNRKLLLLLVCSAMAGGLSGCGGFATHKIADAIKAELPNVVGPADSWDANVSGNEGTMLGGRIPEVQIHGVNAQVSPELTLATLDIDAKDISVDIRNRSVKNIKSLTFAGTITQAQLDRYLRLTEPEDHNRPKHLKVNLRHDDLRVDFEYVQLSIGIPVTLTGRMYVHPSADNKIDFHPIGASVARIPIPRKALEYEMERLNPVVDMSTLTIPVHLTDLRVASGQLLVSGTTEITTAEIEAAKRQADNAK